MYRLRSEKFILQLTIGVLVSLVFAVGAARAEPSLGPAVWKVEGGNAELWIFGTFHMLPEELDWKSSTVTSAFASANTLVLESNPFQQGEIVEHYARVPEGKNFRSYFNDEQAAIIAERMAPYGVTFENARNYKPWYVALQIGLAAIYERGFDPAMGAEAVLTSDALAARMNRSWLEPTEAGIKAFADHPDDVQAQIMMVTLDDIDRLNLTLEELVNGWANGDIESVARLLNEGMETIPELAEAVLYERNRAWMNPLRSMLESEGRYFVAVGAAHLAGPSSVVELLEKQGYAVSRQ